MEFGHRRWLFSDQCHVLEDRAPLKAYYDFSAHVQFSELRDKRDMAYCVYTFNDPCRPLGSTTTVDIVFWEFRARFPFSIDYGVEHLILSNRRTTHSSDIPF